jgi:hypothetical protein
MTSEELMTFGMWCQAMGPVGSAYYSLECVVNEFSDVLDDDIIVSVESMMAQLENVRDRMQYKIIEKWGNHDLIRKD